ncbi:MAG: hypothetical protein ACU826_05015, partial [Gammaproteobacteria bacterium]
MPPRVKIFFVLLPLLAVLAFFTVRVKTDVSAFIIAGDNAEEVLLAGEMQSGALSRRYLVSIGSDDGEPASALFADELARRFEDIDGVRGVWRPGRETADAATIASLYGRYGAFLYSPDAEADLARIFGPGALDQRAEWLKKALLSPQGGLVKQIALHDPLLLTLNGMKTLTDGNFEMLQANARYRNLIVETEAAGLNAPEQSRIQGEIRRIFAELNR